MEIGKTFCGRTDGRTDGRTHLSSNLLGHRRGDDLKIFVIEREGFGNEFFIMLTRPEIMTTMTECGALWLNNNQHYSP